MNEIHGHEPTNNGRRAFRLAGIPVGLALVLALAFALVGSAGAGLARMAVAPSNTSPPAISGTVEQGQTLTADRGAWSGTEPIAYTYAWQRCDSGGGHCTNVGRATATTYMVAKQDVDRTLRFVVTAKNAEATMSATSVATALAKAAATAEPANTSPPTVSGTVQENQTLTADKGAWSGGEPIAYSYEWQRGDSGGGHFANIGGANKATYTLTKADVDHTFRVTVTAKNSDGSSSASSVATAVVKAVAVTPAQSLTLSASTSSVVFGTGTTLSGTISSKQSGQRVTVLAQRYEDAKFSSLANVTTGSGGTWSYLAKPTIQTAYQTQWNKVMSPSLKIGVHPLVTFRAIAGNRFTTRVAAASSFAGKIVQLQRRSSTGQWVTLKRLHLNTSSTVVFPAKLLPKGTSTVRIAFSVNQAGAGYLGGISRTIVYHRG